MTIRLLSLFLVAYYEVNVCEQGKVILEASRQVAAEANYCIATGLHAAPIDDSKCLTSPSGYLAVNTF